MQASLEEESQIRQDPQRRALRTVLLWRQLEAEQASEKYSEDPQVQQRLQSRLTSLAQELKRDPQLESLLRARQKDLGIAAGSHLEWAIRARTIEQALALPTRERGLGR